jgi:TetR/AcrR family transcriptional regulator, cholesterol catabolism regulator
VAERTTPTRARGNRRASGTGNGGRRRDQEVLDAAAKVFHVRGYADASVQHIADELGILKGSLYHYIDSKEDLLFRILDEAHHEVESILSDVEAMDAAPLEKLHEYTRRQVEYTSRNLAKMAIYYHDVDKLSEDRRKDVLRRRRVHEQFVIDCITLAQERGETRKGLDARLTTNYLFGSMIWVYRWYRPSGKHKPAQVATECADFVIAGITG